MVFISKQPTFMPTIRQLEKEHNSGKAFPKNTTILVPKNRQSPLRIIIESEVDDYMGMRVSDPTQHPKALLTREFIPGAGVVLGMNDVEIIERDHDHWRGIIEID